MTNMTVKQVLDREVGKQKAFNQFDQELLIHGHFELSARIGSEHHRIKGSAISVGGVESAMRRIERHSKYAVLVLKRFNTEVSKRASVEVAATYHPVRGWAVALRRVQGVAA